MKQGRLDRRAFLGAAAAVAVVPRHVLGGPAYKPPSEKLNIAGVGVGGKGFSDLQSVARENIVALCDVDRRHMARAAKQWPDAKTHADFRRMLETQKDIDAVIVATPDHTHAVISVMAMKLGKHVFCQKPLAHSVAEAHRMAQVARETGVATQMGNQGQATEEARLVAETVWDGAIGPVREVHAWSNRYPRISPRGIPRPADTPPVPEGLDWDLWLGPAPARPYHPCYTPFAWRGWWDFGTGVLGDIGCHELSAIYKALDLGAPETVEASSTNYQAPPEVRSETAPLASVTRYRFPAKGDRPAVTVIWYDGGIRPPRPDELEPDRKFGEGDGILYVGDKGRMLGHRLVPDSRQKEYGRPPQKLARSPGHYVEWINACKGGPPAGSNFVDHAGPLAEAVLMGVVAIRTNRKLAWDPAKRQFANAVEANAYLDPPYREGWTLG